MNQEKNLLKIVKTGLILSFFTPLVLGPFGITLSAYPKAVFFRAIIAVTFIFYLLLLYYNQKYFPKLSFLVLTVIFFNGILILSSLLGINPIRSIIGTQDRGEGVILHIHFLMFFLMLISVFNAKEEWFKILKLAFIVASLSSFAGFLQKLFYPHFFTFYGNSLPERISGTLANPDFFGAYMSLSIFLGLFIFLLEKEKDYKIVWLSLIALNFLTFLWAQTRAAWAGFAIGFFLFFILLSSKYSNINPKKKKLILSVVLILFFLGVLIILNYQSFHLDKFYYFNRLLSSFNLRTLAPRFSVWQIAIDGWKERPILGWGPESFGYLFDKYFKASYLSYTREFYFDYPHNKFLGILSDAGIIGLLSYLSIFAAAFYLIFKNSKSNYFGSNSSIIRLAFFSFLSAYLIQNVFAFDTIAIYFLLYLALAFINNNFSKSDSDSLFNKRKASIQLLGAYRPFPNKLKNPIIFALILITAIMAYQMTIKPTIASTTYVNAIRSGYPDFGDVLAGMKKSVSYNSVFDKDIKLEIAKVLISYVNNISDAKTKKETMDFLLDIRKSLEERIEKPEVRYLTSHELLAKIDEVNYLFTKDSALVSSMENILKKALSFNNQQPELYRMMGETKMLQNNYKEAEDYYRKSFELGPQDAGKKIEFYRLLGAGYYLAGDKEKAVENYKKAIDLSFSLDKTNPNFFSPSFKENPNQIAFWDWVALTYFKDLKDSKTSYEIYEMAMEFFPKYKNDFKARLDALKSEEKTAGK